MITKIKIRNFQGHRLLTIPLSASVTTIVGTTDSGKSAVLRALRWICLNQPDGDEFITHGEDECVVTVYTADGHKVTRVRGKGVNEYRLDGRRYVSFGRGQVPADVAAVLNVGPTNFQSQLEPPFWFFDPPGQVSKNLNAVVDLSKMDAAVAEANRRVRQASAEATVAEKRLAEAREEKKKLSWVPSFCQDVDNLVAIHDRLQQKTARASSLAVLVDRAARLQERQQSLRAAAQSGKKVVVLGERLRDLQGRADKLAGLIQKYEQLEAVPKSLPDVSRLYKLRATGDALSERVAVLEELTEKLEQLEEQRCKAREKLAEMKSTLESIPTCPTCGKPLSPSSPPTSTSGRRSRRLGARLTGTPS